jgi:acetolactate synthase-1/2/3 large subunit
MKKRGGGKILIESLSAHGVRKVFCVPGESYLPALDALTESTIRTVACRHEGGAAFMAEAYAKLTGHPGVCFVTRGPGACNAAIGVHTAMQDSTPFILFVGQVARADLGREAFQEVDYESMFGPPFSKWVVQVGKAADLPHAVQQAFDTATSERPGPVVVVLPEDILSEESDAPALPPLPPAHFAPTHTDLETLKDILRAADKPLVIVGGGGWTDAAIDAFADFCGRADIPVATAFRRNDAFPNDHDCYAGVLGFTTDPRLVAAVKEADVILAVGTRLNDTVTQGYTAIEAPQPRQKLIHIHSDATELNRVYKADLAIHSTTPAFVETLAGAEIEGPWGLWRERLRGEYAGWSTPKTRDKFPCDLEGVIEDIIDALPDDAILTTDAGNFGAWVQRFVRFRRPMRLLAPVSGAMGYGAPAAVAASLTHPGRAVVGFMGDGGALMTGNELATAVKEGAHPVFLIFNNNMYGTIRMHQEREFPGRVSATDLVNPDFAAWAKSFGVSGETVARTEDFLPAFRRALNSGKPAVIEVKMDPEQITTTRTLSAIRG